LAAAAALISDHRVDALVAFGVEAPGGRAIDEGTLFGIGSITKLLTGIAGLRLQERGVLDLGERVQTMVPDLVFDDKANGGEVTVRHLLTHTSGLPAAGRDWGPPDDGGLRRFALEDLAHHRFLAPPGTVPCYSSTAYSLAGLVLEEAAGARFSDLLGAEVLVPAGMDSATYPDGRASRGLAWPHYREAQSWVRANQLADNRAGSPSGFLLASIHDMARLAVALLSGGLLTELNELWSRPVSRRVAHAGYPMANASSHLGLGCFTGVWNRQRVVRHGGMQQSFNCSVDFFTDTGKAMALLTNGASDEAFSELLMAGYEALVGPPIEAEDHVPEDLARAHQPSGRDLSGSFLDVDSCRLVSISEEGESFSFREGDVSGPLVEVAPDHFLAYLPAGRVPIWYAPDPEPIVLVWGTPFLRVETATWHPGRQADILSGIYQDSFWPDPSTDITVSFDGGEWRVEVDGDLSIGSPIGVGAVASAHGLIEFAENGNSFRLGYGTRYVRKAASITATTAPR
jgi:CubicO group peptidase (beta-lactamase class C family)